MEELPLGGGTYHIDLLSTTCHVFWTKDRASPDGRHAHSPISDGASPAQGADRNGPAAVIKSLAKIDSAKTGGCLLNQRFLPQTLEGEKGIDNLTSLIKTFFRLGGHHIQFNVVDTKALREAQKSPRKLPQPSCACSRIFGFRRRLDRNHQERNHKSDGAAGTLTCLALLCPYSYFR